jgi:hypothetical protein
MVPPAAGLQNRFKMLEYLHGCSAFKSVQALPLGCDLQFLG